MLTRLKVSGFKNLVDVDVRFGPFTCVAGANGTGKSNLFDAIQFLSALADRPLIDAALSVRDEGGRTGDIRSLFHRVGDTYADEMTFETEMIVPFEGVDDLGQQAEASITFLRYAVTLAYRSAAGNPHGRASLVLPPLNTLEQLPDAKRVLYDLLREASGLTGRRRKQFRVRTRARRVAEFVNDFSPLRTLCAFRKLEADVRQVADAHGWNQ